MAKCMLFIHSHHTSKSLPTALEVCSVEDIGEEVVTCEVLPATLLSLTRLDFDITESSHG